MSGHEPGLRRIWPDTGPLIGMVHLLPLPGAPRWMGSMDQVVERAVSDACSLEAAGFDGVLVENYLDVPFFPREVPAETVAALTRCVGAVLRAIALPVGVNVLRNDSPTAMAISAAAGARFVRANVHTGAMWTDQGLLGGRAHETLRVRRNLQVDVAILADVHVKHAVAPSGSEIGAAASDAWHRGLADALVVSGPATGAPTPTRDLRRVREAVPEACVLVGSGVTADNVVELLGLADGAIVGSSVMTEGRAGSGVDPARASELVSAARA